MTPQEIYEKVQANNKKIQENAMLTFDSFMLNETVASLLEENHKLQALCTHEFNHLGQCTICSYLKRGLD